MSDSQERTEQATDKRMKDVHSKGKLQRSQDVTAWVSVGAAGAMIPGAIAAGTDAAREQMAAVQQAALDPDPTAAISALFDGMGSVLPTVSLLFVAVVVAVIGGAVLQGGVHIKTQLMKFEQLDLVKGIGRTFGLQALWQGAKALLKTIAVGLVLYLVIQSLMPVLTASGGLALTTILDAAAGGAAALLIAAVAAGLVLAAADMVVVMKKNNKQTMMTKREVSDENKNSEGDPLIKGQRRSRQLAMSRNRMMAAVGDADVVIINPTEYAVALSYEPGKAAPRVVAKGQGIIAARIREEAERSGVPMIRDIPLTRAIHAACELGQEIPVEHYGAVATVLTFVAALKRRGAARGVHSITPSRPLLGGI